MNKGKKRFILNKKNANMLDVDMHARREKKAAGTTEDKLIATCNRTG